MNHFIISPPPLDFLFDIKIFLKFYLCLSEELAALLTELVQASGMGKLNSRAPDARVLLFVLMAEVAKVACCLLNLRACVAYVLKYRH